MFDTTRIVLESDKNDINTQVPLQKNSNVFFFEHCVMAYHQVTMTDLMTTLNKVTANAIGNKRLKHKPI